MFSQECTEKDREGRAALTEAQRIDVANKTRLEQIENRLSELSSIERRVAEERLDLARERKQVEALKNMQLCAGCKQPINRNPHFSLSVYPVHNSCFVNDVHFYT